MSQDIDGELDALEMMLPDVARSLRRVIGNLKADYVRQLKDEITRMEAREAELVEALLDISNNTQFNYIKSKVKKALSSTTAMQKRLDEVDEMLKILEGVITNYAKIVMNSSVPIFLWPCCNTEYKEGHDETCRLVNAIKDLEAERTTLVEAMKALGLCGVKG